MSPFRQALVAQWISLWGRFVLLLAGARRARRAGPHAACCMPLAACASLPRLGPPSILCPHLSPLPTSAAGFWRIKRRGWHNLRAAEACR